MRYIFLDKVKEKYLIFTIQDWRFAIPVSSIIEIIAYKKPEKIPNTWEYIEGVILYRQSICPILNLSKKFGIRNNLDKKAHQFIIINNSYGILGLQSDTVYEIKEPNNETILTDWGTIKNDCLKWFTGKLQIGKKYICILDLDKLLENPEIASLKEIEVSEILDSVNKPESEGGTVNESL